MPPRCLWVFAVFGWLAGWCCSASLLFLFFGPWILYLGVSEVVLHCGSAVFGWLTGWFCFGSFFFFFHAMDFVSEGLLGGSAFWLLLSVGLCRFLVGWLAGVVLNLFPLIFFQALDFVSWGLLGGSALWLLWSVGLFHFWLIGWFCYNMNLFSF